MICDQIEYKYQIRLPITGTYQMSKWCKENCEDDYCGAVTSVFWWFNSESDAVAFKLTWL